MQSSRTPLAAYGQRCPSQRQRSHVRRNRVRKARHVEPSDNQCRSLFTFRELCANLPLDTAKSRSNTRPQLWPRRCRLSGHSIRGFEIASQRSKAKCGSISTFSLGTKISDIQVDSRVLSLTELRFRSSPPSVVAERIPVMYDPLGPALSARLNAQAIPNALKAALGRDPFQRLMSGPSVDSGRMRANWQWP